MCVNHDERVFVLNKTSLEEVTHTHNNVRRLCCKRVHKYKRRKASRGPPVLLFSGGSSSLSLSLSLSRFQIFAYFAVYFAVVHTVLFLESLSGDPLAMCVLSSRQERHTHTQPEKVVRRAASSPKMFYSSTGYGIV